MKQEKKLTPMMAQYIEMRRSLPEDVILFFRLGDFYELFFEDAKRSAEILGIALTKRHDVPMCGVPHHASQGYIAKLVRAGVRVAIGEQTSTPIPGKLVEREISQIISAGTVDDINLLDDTKHNYLVSVYTANNLFGLACIEHTTGEFTVAQFTSIEQLCDEIKRLSPSETLVPDNQEDLFEGLFVNMPYDSYSYILDQAEYLLKNHFKIQSFEGFGCAELPEALCAAGAVLHYLTYQLRRSCEHLQTIKVQQLSEFVLIDSASQQNLDLVDSTAGKEQTLLKVLDKTATPMGARKLRHWILHPLRDVQELKSRQEVITSFLEQPYLLEQVRGHLKQIRDVERTTTRLAQGRGNPRDLRSLANSLAHIPILKQDVNSVAASVTLANTLLESIQTFDSLVILVQGALMEEPPVKLQDGGVISEGHNTELDELRAATREGKSWIAQLQKEEREKTGIETLKVKYNNVFGYFLEVTKAKVDLVPERYMRKQTMANAERYITEELKELENKVLGAEERSKQLEIELFTGLRNKVAEYTAQILTTAEALATLDVLLGLADHAQHYQHVCPELDGSKILEIKGGRHPVLEKTLVGEQFVPNSTDLSESFSLALLTGPNMAGKSTYIRQVALITLMAQIGAYVPATSAKIGVVDRIFCRVGASDNIAKGQSTFMVEMNETALIINNATYKSLVVLDEIGRGTATFDGLSIAWSVAEYLHDELKSRTLFATHYHELTDLVKTKSRVKNFHVAVREWKDEIIFLRQIVEGVADKSYGIQVAKLAGLPDSVIERAKEILATLEGEEQGVGGLKKQKIGKKEPEDNHPEFDFT